MANSLSLTTGMQAGFARINTHLVNHALSYVALHELPTFACTSRANQAQVVSFCFRQMKEVCCGGVFACFASTVTCCRGRNRPFRPADIFQIDGPCKLEDHLNDISYLLGDSEHNRRLAAKLPNLTQVMMLGATPDLSPFAIHCTKLSILWLQDGTVTDETRLEADFPSLERLVINNCPQLADAGIDLLLSRCPKIATCCIIPKFTPGPTIDWTPKIIAVNRATHNGTLNAMYHADKKEKKESKKE